MSRTLSGSSRAERIRSRILFDCTYTRRQPAHFVRVRQYIILQGLPDTASLRKETNTTANSLLLRMENETEFTVLALRLQLIQLDNEGKTIAKSCHTLEHLHADPGTTFTPDEALLLHPSCTAVTIQILSVDSDLYRYTMQNGERIVTFLEPRPKPQQRTVAAGPTRPQQMYRKKTPPDFRCLRWLSITITLVILALGAYSVLYEQIGEPIDRFVVNQVLTPIQTFFSEILPSWFKWLFDRIWVR